MFRLTNAYSATITSTMDMALWDDPPMSMSMTQEPIDWRYLPYIYIYKALFSGLNFRGYPHNSYGQTYGTFTYLQ